MTDITTTVRSSQKSACRALAALYDEHPELPPLHWTISDLDTVHIPQLRGQVSRSKGDVEYRVQLVADYAAAIAGEPYTDGDFFQFSGTYRGVSVHIYSLIGEASGDA